MTVSTGSWVCPKGACWCGRSAGGSPSPGCWSQWRCRGCAGCSSSTAATMTLGHEGGGTGHGIQPSGLEILILGCWAGQWTRSWVGRCGTLPGSPADSPLLELSTNLREDLVAGEVGALNKEKVLVGAFSRHCETSRRFVDSTTLYSNRDIMRMRSYTFFVILLSGSVP